MRKGLVVAAALALACFLLPGAGGAAKSKPVYAGTCGLPSATPLWMDFGWPDFSSVFGRSGVIVSASSGDFGAQMRAAGADTVYWDMYLNKRVGQPSAPADPSTIVDKANKLYDYAAQQMGCATPVVIENELFGASLATPWSETNATYRQNVLTFLRQLAARGAFPMLLVNSTPYTGGDAAAWWQQVAQVSDLVRETYVPATLLYPKGPIVANRILRTAYRTAVEQLTSIGIPPQRVGLIVTMSTTVGFGGRNGLQPASAWLDVVKWQALSLREVAAETGISTLWSWGWGEWSAAEKDPDKQAAACVWLWARSPALCNGPDVGGADFDRSLTEGQIRLRLDVQCTVGKQRLSNDSIQKLQLMTGDRDTAFTALYARLVESGVAPVTRARAAAAERAIVAGRFHGSWAAYGTALTAAHANRATALGILADELRRAKIETGMPVGSPSPTAIQNFYSSYPDLLVRPVRTKQPAPWLGGRKRGWALEQIAPAQVFDLPDGKSSTVTTPLGRYAVKPLGSAVPLGSLPVDAVSGAIAAALRSFERGTAYERWTQNLQTQALAETICARDDMPAPGAVELSTYLPFLALAG